MQGGYISCLEHILKFLNCWHNGLMVMNYIKRIICQFNAVISFAGLVNQDGSNS